MLADKNFSEWIMSHANGKSILVFGQIDQGFLEIISKHYDRIVNLLINGKKNITFESCTYNYYDTNLHGLALGEENIVEYLNDHKKEFDAIIILNNLNQRIESSPFIELIMSLLQSSNKLLIGINLEKDGPTNLDKKSYIERVFNVFGSVFLVDSMSFFNNYIGLVCYPTDMQINLVYTQNMTFLKSIEDRFQHVDDDLLFEMRHQKALRYKAEEHAKLLEQEHQKRVKKLLLRQKKTEQVLAASCLPVGSSEESGNRLNEHLLSMISDSTFEYRKHAVQRQRLIHQFETTKQSIAYLVGCALVKGVSSLNEFFKLPGVLAKIYRQAKSHGSTQNAKWTDEETCLVPPLERHSLYSQVWQFKRALSKQNDIDALHSLRMACIVDEFTYYSFKDECNLLQLTPIHWKEELSNFKPDILFIESAWRGKDDLWTNVVEHTNPTLVQILQWSNDNAVPSAFWNKEDPVRFSKFLPTAALFDIVFTTDLDCIPLYKRALCHENVYLLPFAAQPTVHNPIEICERKDAFCFAGAYYHKYPERQKTFDNFLKNLPSFRPIEIYDRNHDKDDPNYAFPEAYRYLIKGGLSYDRIEIAYKGYLYAISLNSVTHSQCMFARRVYELLASNTITVSNYSRGISLLLGDLVFQSNDGNELASRLTSLSSTPYGLEKHRLKALRSIMRDHTYQDRLAYICSKVFNVSEWDLLPHALVLSFVRTNDDVKFIFKNFNRQLYINKKLVIIFKQSLFFSTIENIDANNIQYIAYENADEVSIQSLATEDSLVFYMNTADYYSENYILDIVLATRYSDAQVISKGAHFFWDGQTLFPPATSKAYTLEKGGFSLAKSGARCRLFGNQVLTVCLENIRKSTYNSDHVLFIDIFNYCKNAYAFPGFGCKHVATVSDSTDAIAYSHRLDWLQKYADKLPVAYSDYVLPDGKGYSPEHLLKVLGPPPKSISISMVGGKLKITASLGEKYTYWHSAKRVPIESLPIKDGKLLCNLLITPMDFFQLAVIPYTKSGTKLKAVMCPSGKNSFVKIPSDASTLDFAIRIRGTVSAWLDGLSFSAVPQPTPPVGVNDCLLITNVYPSYDNVYRNAFVHSRVKAYQEQGLSLDVFRFSEDFYPGFHEFQGVECITGDGTALQALIKNGRYKVILVHVLLEPIWNAIKPFVKNISTIVWVHGFEIQPYHRRCFNYSDPEEQYKAKAIADARMHFWRSILSSPPATLKMVFVSRQFSAEVMADLGFRLPYSSYRIIHNPIDTDLFQYIPKSADQRKKLLSIRPYTSAKYGNDITVKIILELSKESFFKELEFLLIGNGPLFDETLEPVKYFSNVKIHKGFLTHQEIADLQKDYGIFLTPTRWDSHGVSRDEAMSAGLVPVTNAVSAIPEFVDADSCILAPADDHIALAHGIKRLYEHPTLFCQMSHNARARVCKQSAKKSIIAKEIAFISEMKELSPNPDWHERDIYFKNGTSYSCKVFTGLTLGRYALTLSHKEKRLHDNPKGAYAAIALNNIVPPRTIAEWLGISHNDKNAYFYIGGGSNVDGVYTVERQVNIPAEIESFAVVLRCWDQSGFSIDEVSLKKVRSNKADPQFPSCLSGFIPPDVKISYVLYADINLDIVDGSSIWLSSAANILANLGPVLVIAKRSCKTNHILEGMAGNKNIYILFPSDLGYTGVWSSIDAITWIRKLDAVLADLKCIIVRGTEATCQLLADRQFKYRTGIYLTDFYHIKNGCFEVNVEKAYMIQVLARHGGAFLTQTKILGNYLEKAAGTAINTILFPPAVPADLPWYVPQAKSQSCQKGVSIGYAGKIAPDWGIIELIDWGMELQEKGLVSRIVVVCGKFHSPDPGKANEYITDMQNKLKSAGIEIYESMSRADAIKLMLSMDFIWCWRPGAFEETTLELSTKLVEMAATGARCICYPNTMNKELLGTDYPFFATNMSGVEKILSLKDVMFDDLNSLARTIRNDHSFSSIAQNLSPQLSQTKHQSDDLICFASHDFKFIEPFISQIKRTEFSILRDEWHWGECIDSFWNEHCYENADIIFCEWGLANAVWYSHRNEDKKPLFIRIHRQEIGSKAAKFGPDIKIENVTKVIFVAEWVRDTAISLWGWPIEKTCVIPNFVLDDEFLVVPEKNKDAIHLGMVGITPTMKRFDRAVDLLLSLLNDGIEAKLFIKGHRPEDQDFMHGAGRVKELDYYYELYQYIEDNPLLRDRVIFSPWGNDVSIWYNDIDCILSCSDFESFHYALADGVLAGCLPVIWPWESAKEIYTPDWVIDDTSQAVERIKDFWALSLDMREKVLSANRQLIVERYGKDKIFEELLHLLRNHTKM